MERDRFPTDEERFSNARKAIENGRKSKEDTVLFDLRTHYKKMSRGFGGQRGTR